MFDGDLSVMRLPGQKFITVTDPDLAKTVLLDDSASYVKSRYVNRLLKPAMGEGLLTAEGDRWRMQRRAAAPAFRFENIASLAPIMAGIGERLAEKLAARPPGSRADLMQEIPAATLDIIIAALFGDVGDHYDREQIARDIAIYLQTHGNLELPDYFGFPEWFPRARHRGRTAIRRLRQAARSVVDTVGTRTDHSDLASLLTLARDPETGDPLPTEQVIDNIITFIGAGHEATGLAVTWALSILALSPDLQEQLAAEAWEACGDAPVAAADVEKLALIRRVIQETMRLYPPAAAVGRTALAATQLGSLDLAPGDHVTVAIYVIHRHRKHWPDPARFDPDRFLEANASGRHRFAYMPFCGGSRICIGMTMAMMEATILLATLMRRLRFAPDPVHRIYPQFSITLRSRGGMPLQVSPARSRPC